MVRSYNARIWCAVIAFSVICALIWYGLYRLCAWSRIRQAKRRGTTPNLSPLRVAFLVTGISGQLWYWTLIVAISGWHGMS